MSVSLSPSRYQSQNPPHHQLIPNSQFQRFYPRPGRKHAAKVFQQLFKKDPATRPVIYLQGHSTSYRDDSDREMGFRQESNFVSLFSCRYIVPEEPNPHSTLNTTTIFARCTSPALPLSEEHRPSSVSPRSSIIQLDHQSLKNTSAPPSLSRPSTLPR